MSSYRYSNLYGVFAEQSPDNKTNNSNGFVMMTNAGVEEIRVYTNMFGICNFDFDTIFFLLSFFCSSPVPAPVPAGTGG